MTTLATIIKKYRYSTSATTLQTSVIDDVFLRPSQHTRPAPGRRCCDGRRNTSSMTLVWSVVALVLYLYFLMIVARVVIDVTRQFARSWRPAGVAAIGLEAVYSSTDPPVKL